MTSQYNTHHWRDDLDLEPNTHPAIAHALHHIRTGRIAQMGHDKLTAAPWPFPSAPAPVDRNNPPPRHADPEDAPW